MILTGGQAVLAYVRVYSDLIEKIRNNTYPVGTLLPPEPELEKIYGVSRTTVRRAISMLVNAKRVHVKQGHGTEVIATRSPSVENLYRFSNVTHISETLSHADRPSHSPLFIDQIPASQELADFFKIKPGSMVYRIQRSISFEDGTIIGYKVNYLPPKRFPKLEVFNGVVINVYTLLFNQFSVQLDHAEETITAVAADFMDSTVLKVDIGTPLLLLKRYSHCSSGPMEYAEFKVLPEHYSVTVHMEGSPIQYTT